MLHTVKKAKYLNGYKIEIRFSNGKIKVVDLEEMIKKTKNMLLPLLDIDYFKQVECDGITVCWPNGVDLCPDAPYKMGQEISPASGKLKKERSKTNKSPSSAKRRSRLKSCS